MDVSRLDLLSCTIFIDGGIRSDISHEMKKRKSICVHIRCVLDGGILAKMKWVRSIFDDTYLGMAWRRFKTDQNNHHHSNEQVK